MNIVLTITDYSQLTGSPVYNYELSRELLKQGHSVTILANQIGGEFMKRTPPEIKLYNFFDHPTFSPDLVINSQPEPTAYALTNFPKAKHIQILHSLLSYEEPVIDDSIIKYVAVRPDVYDFWELKYPSIRGRLFTVWNGVDVARFNTKAVKSPTRPMKLFVGTFDHLRRDVILDVMKDSVEKHFDLILVMPDNPFIENPVPENVTVMKPQWNIEELVKRCDETAGIFIGRTTIEGWMCGKPGLVYNVDEVGHILSKETYGVPKNLEHFDISYMTERILENV